MSSGGSVRSATAIALANERVRVDSIANVRFEVIDPFTGSFEEPFDAVVGRYVLQFQPDPQAPYDTTAKVLNIIKGSGVSAFGFVGNEQFIQFGKAAGAPPAK